MNSYDLSRTWFDFCFENPEKIKPNHTAVYFFAIEHCNRLGWKEKFGYPSQMVMEAIGIKSYNTYIKCFNDIVEFGFFLLVERSKNQYSANIIALSNYNKASDKAQVKALDKALIKHGSKHGESTGESTCSINKQRTIEQINKEQETILKSEIDISKMKQVDAPSYHEYMEICLTIKGYDITKIHNDAWSAFREAAQTISEDQILTAIKDYKTYCEAIPEPIKWRKSPVTFLAQMGHKTDWLKQCLTPKGEFINDEITVEWMGRIDGKGKQQYEWSN